MNRFDLDDEELAAASDLPGWLVVLALVVAAVLTGAALAQVL